MQYVCIYHSIFIITHVIVQRKFRHELKFLRSQIIDIIKFCYKNHSFTALVQAKSFYYVFFCLRTPWRPLHQSTPDWNRESNQYACCTWFPCGQRLCRQLHLYQTNRYTSAHGLPPSNVWMAETPRWCCTKQYVRNYCSFNQRFCIDSI